MIQLTKGGNAPLNQTSLTVTVDVAAAADLSALLVTETGKVRTDADFVFYNQPNGPGVTCVPPAGGAPWQVKVDLTQVPSDVHAVRLVTSLDDGGKVFGQVGQPVARVSDAAGAPIAAFAMTGLDRETIVVALELYRRDTSWKVRAIGRGYDGGLAELITDHGVSVDDAPAQSAAAAPPPAAAPPTPPPAPPAAAAPPPAPPAQPAEPQGAPAFGQASIPPSGDQPGAAPAAPGFGQQQAPPPPAPAFGQPPAAPAFGQPPAQTPPAQTPPAQTPPQAPPAQSAPPPPAFGQGQPPQGQPAQTPPPSQPAQGSGGGEVSLTKGRPVSLTKGQKVQLTKDGGQALTLVRMGLGWDPIRKSGLFGSREVDIDLDASAILFAGQQPVDIAFYNQLQTKDGSIQHMGDNRTGEGDGDDEVVVVDLTRVPVHVDTVIFVVTSYEGQTFEKVQNAFCRLIDHTDGELARFALAGGMPYTGLVMAKLYREGGGWKMQAIGDGIAARVPSDAIAQCAAYL